LQFPEGVTFLAPASGASAVIPTGAYLRVPSDGEVTPIDAANVSPIPRGTVLTLAAGSIFQAPAGGATLLAPTGTRLPRPDADGILSVPQGATLRLPAGATLPVPSGATLEPANQPARYRYSGTSASTIPAGTEVKVKALQGLSSDKARSGDPVRVRVADDDMSGLPIGTVLYGRVRGVKASTLKASGVLNLQFGPPPGVESANPDMDGSPFADVASARLTGQAVQNGSSKFLGYGAAAGAALAFTRKRKLGDALAGGLIGLLGGAVAQQVTAKPTTEAKINEGDEFSLHLDRAIPAPLSRSAY